MDIKIRKTPTPKRSKEELVEEFDKELKANELDVERNKKNFVNKVTQIGDELVDEIEKKNKKTKKQESWFFKLVHFLIGIDDTKK